MNKFEEYLKETWHKTKDDIFHNNDLPYDSFDRLFALYLIDTGSNFCKHIAIDELEISNRDAHHFVNLLSDEERGLFEDESNSAYENYEREGMSYECALCNMLDVINKGRDTVLKDSYYDGGWFGAS